MAYQNAMKIFSTAVFLLAFTCTALAAPFTFAQDDKLSKVVVVNGEERILLPDGRIIPMGQGVICTDDCVSTEAPEAPGMKQSSRKWLFLAAIVAAVSVAAIVRERQDCCCLVPPLFPPAVRPPDAPLTPVPESATLALLGFGLLSLAIALRQRKAARC